MFVIWKRCVMRAGRKSIGSVVSIALVLTILTPVTAMAVYEPYGEVVDFTSEAGMTYYDMYANIPRAGLDPKGDYNFLRDAVTNRDNLQNWSTLGYEILKNGGQKVAYWDRNDRGFNQRFGANGSYIDLLAAWNDPGNFKIARSLGDVEEAARERVAKYFVHNDKPQVSIEEIEGIAAWDDDDTEQTVLYTDAFFADNYLGQRYYNYFGLAFYDFKIALLADKDLPFESAADEYSSIEAASEAGAPGVTFEPSEQDGFIGGALNRSMDEAELSQRLDIVHSTTISNSLTNTESYSFDAMIGSELAFGYDAPPLGGASFSFKVYTEFTKGQVYTSAYQTTTENYDSQDKSTNITVKLPPHTQAYVKQTNGIMTATVEYDSPIVVTYKVAVYSLCGHKYWDGLWTHYNYLDSSYLARFGKDDAIGNNAVDNLAARIRNYYNFSNYEAVHGDGLDWSGIYFNNATPEGPRVKSSVDWLRSHKPMNVLGGKLSYDYQGIDSEVYAKTPLYALKYVETPVLEIDLPYGTRKYVRDIPVSGTNTSYVPYYGFDSRYGHWILLDSDRNPVTASPIASLVVDPVSGNAVLTAGETQGVVYLKYVIDEGQYTFGEGALYGQAYTTNANLGSTAVVRVNVVPSVLGEPNPESPSFRHGSAATGGGWYTLEDDSRVNFGFNVKQVPKTADRPEYKGQLLLVNEGKWRLKGSLEMYVSSESRDRAYGTGPLERWESTALRGKGGWVQVGDNVNFSIDFLDAGSLTSPTDSKATPVPADRFGISIQYGRPAGAPPLPNSGLMELGGGSIQTNG
jgi:hypothetical protein